MKELIENWCKRNHLRNLKFTDNKKFAIVDGDSTNLLILIKDKDWQKPNEEDENLIYRKAYRTGKRQIWYVELKDGELEWSLF